MALLLLKFKCPIRVVTQRDFQASRETYSRFINYILFTFLAEVAIAAPVILPGCGMELV
jgi:hypothetical protein